MVTIMDVSRLVPITRSAGAAAVAEAAYAQLIGTLESLDAADWARPTQCPPWTVSDLVGHLIGAAKQAASVREMVRQQVWGVHHRGSFEGNPMDATNALQVADHATLTPAERVTALRDLAPKAVRGRMRMPALVRSVNVPIAPGGSSAPGVPDRLNLGHLFDIVFTRDVWLHTMDITWAVGRTPILNQELDRTMVADVVAEWSQRHGQPVELHLSGPAGGIFSAGAAGPVIEVADVEFIRILSGRSAGSGLLEVRVHF